MKKIVFLLLIVVVLLTSCNRQKHDFYLKPQAESDAQSKEIVCWGDSMTAGFGASEAEVVIKGTNYNISYLSYPEILQGLTGMKTYNFGVCGATSEEIAIMQGGVVPQQDLSSYDVIDSDIMDQAKQHTGDVLILEIGSNGGWKNYAELISQYNAMISFSGCKEYIIVGDTDDPKNSFDPITSKNAADDVPGIGIEDTAWESAMRDAFGDHFINMRVFLIENGLTVAGMEETEDDIEAAQFGNISVQLRSDWTHFNTYGYYAQAVGVYRKGQQLGYWE